ncbi:DegT/DnrJ/EryC1/StrS family aminotransferase [Bacteroides sedimenti]|uniref:Cell surface polysaccharide biosynthesis protein n=1 Tax=Bacteroides sedimenti TaxID=2136147 RepID=A0ABN6Z7K3_9BACE
MIQSDTQIPMVDLKGQYLKIKPEIDSAIQDVIDSTSFINGLPVGEFANNLESYTGARHVIPVANGTDALQIALMALGLKPGDEVIVPAFTYIASAEVIALLGMVPVMVDVDYDNFNVSAAHIRKAITNKTKAIIPVHLFGQSCPMEEILQLAEANDLYVIEDNAQSIGAVHTFTDGREQQTGTMGHFGCTSFFPTKNLGCMGDGGALMTNDDELAFRAKMIASHGQSKKYIHDVVGCNSRLDTIQAAILNVKLHHLNDYIEARQTAANRYYEGLFDLPSLVLPRKMPYTTHVFHQFTLKVTDGSRDELKTFLASHGIPSMIYYPLPLQSQQAFADIVREGEQLNTSELLCQQVLSLPMHTELTEEVQNFIIEKIREYAEQ